MYEKKVEIGGVAKSMSEWCRSRGVSLGAVRQRMERHGVSFSDALDSARRRPTFSVGGEERSMAEWCRAYGVSDTTVRRRMASGMSLEQALKCRAQRSGPKKLVTIGGVSRSKSDWCRLFGIRRKLVERRVREGMSFEDALTMPVRHGKSTLRMLSESAGLDWRTVYGRVMRGWTVPEALSTPPLAKDSPLARGRRSVVVGGVQMTAQSASRRIGASASLVGYRIRHGWREEDASTTPPLDPSSRVQYRIIDARRRQLAEMGIVL